ncbi:MAG TPA: polysaccharide deacetylase family protein [Ruminiclostridium sp.]
MRIKFDCFPEGKCKALTMSYDDGQIHDKRLVELFNKFGIRGTFHLNSGNFDKEGSVRSSEVATLYKGHEVSVHTVSHPHLGSLPKEAVINEIMEDRRALEKLTGYPVRGMSYPFGTYTDEVVDLLPMLGIEYSRTVVATEKFDLPENYLVWTATCHHNAKNLMELGESFNEIKEMGRMRLMYVWGHSYEFDRNNNWEIIEEFCSFMSNKEDIWYATNIEIVDYIKAVRNLKISADNDIIYNPSALSVWISVDGNSMKIKSGETVRLG